MTSIFAGEEVGVGVDTLTPKRISEDMAQAWAFTAVVMAEHCKGIVEKRRTNPDALRHVCAVHENALRLFERMLDLTNQEQISRGLSPEGSCLVLLTRTFSPAEPVAGTFAMVDRRELARVMLFLMSLTSEHVLDESECQFAAKLQRVFTEIAELGEQEMADAHAEGERFRE